MAHSTRHRWSSFRKLMTHIFQSAAHKRRPCRPRTQLFLEPLEGRLTPSTIQWTGADDLHNTNWSDGANWAGGVAPGAGDIAVFTNNKAVQSFASTVDAGFTIAGLDIDSTWGAPGGNIYVNNPLTVTGNFTMASGGFKVSADVTIAGSASDWSGGLINLGTGGFTNTGTLTLSNSGTMALNGGGTLANQGTILQSGAGNLQIQNDATLDNQSTGTYDFTADSGMQQAGGGPDIFSNEGLLEKTGGTGTSTINTTFDNSNAITVTSGTLSLDATGGASTGGTFTVGSGAVLDLTGGGSVVYGGTYTGSGAGTVLLGSGALSVASGGATFNLPSGLFQWTGGTIDVSKGNLTNNGTITLANAGTVALNGTGTNAGQLINSAGKTITQKGTGNLQIQNDATFTNKGIYDITADSGIQQAGGGPDTFVNTGTLEKTAGTGTSTISSTLKNTGTVKVTSGTLSITGSITQVSNNTLTAGAWTAQGTSKVSATLSLGSSFTTIGSKARVTVFGTLGAFTNLTSVNDILSGGSLSLLANNSLTTSGALTDNGKVTLSPGSVLTTTGAFTATSTSVLTEQLGNVLVNKVQTPSLGHIVSSGPVTVAGKLIVTSKITPAVHSPFTVLDNTGTGAVSGIFTDSKGNPLNEGSTFTVTAGTTTMTFQITYQGGSGGNSIVITRTS